MNDHMTVRDLADHMGRSEASIRAALARNDAWLPPAQRLGRRIFWVKSEVEAFLRSAATPYRVDDRPRSD